MTFLVTVYINGAIVMAADSRMTFKSTGHYTDTAQKLFVTESGVGISTCGEAYFDGHLIQEHLEIFCRRHPKLDVDDAPQAIVDYFRKMNADISTTFYVSGYSVEGDHSSCKVYRIRFNGSTSTIEKINDGPGSAWDGQSDIISRLFTDVYVKRTDANGKVRYLPHAGSKTKYSAFTIQDAIDFATTSMEIVKGMLRLQDRQVNVGGPTDILLITPYGYRWIARKELHA